MKKTILAIALAAVSTTAFADTSFSGHVNYVIGDLEDFNANEDITVNNATTSQSRFRIKSSIESNGITYGLRIEHGLVDSGVNRRFDEVYIKGGFGKLTLGQGSEAGDGAVENDYSGTYLTQGDLGSWQLPSVTVGGSTFGFKTPDGGRTERLRYDLPKMGIFSAAVSIDTQDTVSAEANLKGSIFKASVYTASKGDAAGESDEVGGSIALKLGGFTAAVGVAQVDETAAGADDSYDYSNIVLGYNVGKVSFSVDAKTNKYDDLADDLETDTLGVNFVYRPTKGVELYAGYREAEAEIAGVSADGDGILMGARVKF